MVNKNSASEVASDDDLLTEIFRRLPVNSLLRFKSVSKRWLSLINHPYLHRRRRKPISGLIFNNPNPTSSVPEFDFIPLDGCPAPFTTLEFAGDKPGMTILSSCNGLLCCCSTNSGSYYVYNPTTRSYAGIPKPPFSEKQGRNRVNAVTLAFDPAVSPHFTVVLVVLSDDSLPGPFHVKIYSSETGKWKKLQRPLPKDLNYKLGVYWNGAVNWPATHGRHGLYFNAEKESFGEFPMPPLPAQKRVRYMQESSGHLHLIDVHGPRTAQFEIYEMERDYSGWAVKFRVDIESVMKAFPESINKDLRESDPFYYRFLTTAVIRGGGVGGDAAAEEEDSFLVFSVPGKVIRYGLAGERKRFSVIREFGSDGFGQCGRMLGWFDCFHFIESFSDPIFPKTHSLH
ncbi:unnamed protein product [Cuscuta campestris]|uniref:F-box domain-containing protein n=1 Tax=Cuscuta campestris TaxID=132261 RepID=A0A484LMD1_9ASTE|nr:unnamed protein product [Cuscuta campestris]